MSNIEYKISDILIQIFIYPILDIFYIRYLI